MAKSGDHHQLSRGQDEWTEHSECRGPMGASQVGSRQGVAHIGSGCGPRQWAMGRERWHWVHAHGMLAFGVPFGARGAARVLCDLSAEPASALRPLNRTRVARERR